MSKLRIRRLLAAALFVSGALASACSEPAVTDGANAPELPESPAPAGVFRVAPDTVTLAPGDSLFFVATDSLTSGTSSSADVEWSATGGTVDANGLFHAPAEAGAYRVVARGPNGSDTAHVVVATDVEPSIAMAVSSSYWLEIAPGSLTVPAGGTAQFTAAFKTSSGASYGIRPVWSATGGTINAAGRYTAPQTNGSYLVIVKREGDSIADSALVTVSGGAAGSPSDTVANGGSVGSESYRRSGFWIEVLPSTLSLSAGGKQQFTAIGRSFSKTYGIRVNWRATGGSITSSGYYTAPSSNGSYRVIATRVGDVQADTTVVTVGSGGGSTPPPSPPTLSSVVVTPGTASLAASAKQQFTAAGKMSDGSTGSVSVTWSATGGAVTSAGMYTAGTAAGTYRVIAVQQGGTRADTSSITVTATAPVPPPPASNGTTDPTLLSAVNGQAKNVAAYTALNVRGMPAGGSYQDPVTGVRVWKVTSATVPLANGGTGHDYSEGPVQASREWGGNKHTLLVRVDGSGYWLVDLTRGVGLSNWRQPAAGPSTSLAATFSQNPATPQILYVQTGSGLVRVNTATNRVENTGNFPGPAGVASWITQDKNDGWFVGMGSAGGTVVAWHSGTNQTLTRSFSGLDEPYFERDGRYVFANTGGRVADIWDLQTNTTYKINAPGQVGYGHNPALRGFFIGYDVATGAGQVPTWRLDPTTAAQHTQISTLNGYAPDGHSSGQWIQEDATLPGGDKRKQWFLRSTYNWSYTAFGNGANEAIAFLRADGTDFRLLLHHYAVFGSNLSDLFRYYSTPRGSLSPDGKIVLFESNMNGATPARYELFAAEVPLR